MGEAKKVMVSVISDLVSDQRVHKVCIYLHQKGFEVTLIGRKLKKSKPVEDRVYRTERIQCYFNKGILLYAEYNLKLFFRLLFKKADLFLSNDLDTLLPNYISAKFKSAKLVYDSHEYFTGTPELKYKPIKRNVWRWLEKKLLPKADFLYTVNQSIADLYNDEYGVDMKVVRNLPSRNYRTVESNKALFEEGRFVLLMQGAGINKDRGAEELIEAMQLLPSNFLLLFIGSGDVWVKLKDKTSLLQLSEKITFIDKVPFERLSEYTKQAQLGLSFDKPNCINHQLSLPNEVFDYIHAGIPILASDVIEVKKLVENYKVGYCIDEISPKAIADAVLWIYKNEEVYYDWKKNTKHAAEELTWEKEQRVLDIFFDNI